MDIIYDKPIYIKNELQFEYLKDIFAGAIAHRIDEHGRFWIKIWDMRKASEISDFFEHAKFS